MCLTTSSCFTDVSGDYDHNHDALAQQWTLDPEDRAKRSSTSPPSSPCRLAKGTDGDASTNTDSNTGEFMFIYSQKGKIQLQSHDGFLYVKEKHVHEKIYWRCTCYTTKLKCHARIHTLKHEIVRQSQHNHAPIMKRRANGRNNTVDERREWLKIAIESPE